MIRQLILFVLMLTSALGLSCHKSTVPTKNVPGAHGTILCFGEGNYIFNVSDGEYYTFDFPNERYSPEIFCVDGTDSLILGSNLSRLIDPNVSPTPRGNALYKYSPPDTFARLIRPLSDSSSAIGSIDCWPESGKYLYSGGWADEWRLLVFDSAFKRISDLTEWVQREHDSKVMQAYWLDSVTILSRLICGGTISLNIHDGSWRRFGYGRIVAISSDRSRIVLLEGERGGSDQRFEVHDLNTGNVDTVDVSDDLVGCSVALSPDHRFLAYDKVDGFMEMDIRLHIFDLVDGIDYETELVTVRHRGWSLLWLDEIFPLPDSL